MHSYAEYGPLLPGHPRPRVYAVKECQNWWCWRGLWDRDLNAAFNMLFLFWCWVTGHARPACFGPANPVDEDAMEWEALHDLLLMQNQGYV